MSMPTFPTTPALVLAMFATMRRPHLTGYYTFDNAAAPGADYSGNNDTATLTGTTDAAGISGRARSFSAATDAMDI